MLFKSFLFVGLIILCCCKGNQHISSQETNSDVATEKQEQLQSLPPESCRIIGKVISIEPINSASKGSAPCDKFPCDAAVQIVQVLGYGSSFSTMLYSEDVINLHFSFTLNNTKQAFPNQEVIELPGLNVGDLFDAHIQGNLLNNKKFTVNEYSHSK